MKHGPGYYIMYFFMWAYQKITGKPVWQDEDPHAK